MVIMIVLAVIMAAIGFLLHSQEDEEPNDNHPESSEKGDGMEAGGKDGAELAAGIEGDNHPSPEEGGERGEDGL